jgi:hypothetical protein
MALPLLAQIGIMAAPSIMGGLASAFSRKPKASPYERRLSRLVDMYGQDASKPLNQTATFKQGMAEVDKNDLDARQRLNRSLTRTGATDESKMASAQSLNDTRQKGLLGVLKQSDFSRQQSISNVLSLDRARQEQANQRINQRNDGINAVTSGLSGAASSIIGIDQERDYMNFLKGKGKNYSSLGSSLKPKFKPTAPKISYQKF